MVNDIILSGMAWASSLTRAFITRVKEERGQDLMEYAVLAGAIAVVAGFVLYATNVEGAMNDFGAQVVGCLSFDGGSCG